MDTPGRVDAADAELVKLVKLVKLEQQLKGAVQSIKAADELLSVADVQVKVGSESTVHGDTGATAGE